MEYYPLESQRTYCGCFYQLLISPSRLKPSIRFRPCSNVEDLFIFQRSLYVIADKS